MLKKFSLLHSSLLKYSTLKPRPENISPRVYNLIIDTLNKNKYVLFMKGTPGFPKCGFSRLTCQILELNGLNRGQYKSIDVLEDEELREGIKLYSEWPTIPQLYVKGEFIGGCDIVKDLHLNGQLKDVLNEEKEE